MGGAATAIDYLRENGLLLVKPGTSYAVPEYSAEIGAIKEKCRQEIIESSWRMVFAEDEQEFYRILSEMQTTVTGIGYEDVFAVDEANCEEMFAEAAALQ